MKIVAVSDHFVRTEHYEECFAKYPEFELTEVTEQANLLKGDSKSQAIFCRDYVFQAMKELREPADRLEMLVDEENWPFPTYGELLYNI